MQKVTKMMSSVAEHRLPVLRSAILEFTVAVGDAVVQLQLRPKQYS